MIKHTLRALAFLVAGAPLAQAQVDWSAGVPHSYDYSGNVASIGADTFAYDGAGRLVHAQVNGVTRTYTYDPFGNRLTCAQAAADCQERTIHSTTNRLSGAVYDDSGNLRSYADHAYTVDALNMQTRQAVTGTTPREYIYTADDERIAVYTTGTWWQWTVRDFSGRVMREFMSEDASPSSPATANFKWTKDYVWRDRALVASRQIPPGGTAAVTYHYHTDHLGTPRRITNENDVVIGRHDYYAFGPEAPGALNEPSLSLLKYTGHERDVINGTPEALDYMHARYYDAKVGRFLSVDPTWESADSRNPQTWNRYAYVRNNPVNRIDPDGRIDDAIGPSMMLDCQLNDCRPDWEHDKRSVRVGVGSAAVVGAGFLGTAAVRGGITLYRGYQALQQAYKLATTATAAYKIAMQGGKHAGTLRNYAVRATSEIAKAVKGYERVIAEHIDKLKNPAKSVADWAGKTGAQQQIIRQKWLDDIARNRELRDVMEGLLNSRQH
jgi:RHS repeat-associated protein